LGQMNKPGRQPLKQSSKPRRVRRGPLPFVFVNMAMTADGKIATANHEVSSFGSAVDQDHLLTLRTQADAVMAGARTVDSGPVNLGPGPARFRLARRRAGRAAYNLRVIVSGSGTICPEAEIFRHHFSPIILLTTERISQRRLRRLGQLVDVVKVCGRDEVDFEVALRWLRQDWGVRRLLCEGGGELNGALLRAGLVDEINLTVCPWIFGGRTAPTLAEGMDAHRLAEAARFGLRSVKQVGEEIFLIYRRKDGTRRGG
jgi:2,5-diamino-6-(ribosylamino)-4(3H)-pyrimidinone 5'-phosphate reductase